MFEIKSEEKLKKESAIQNEINTLIDNNESLVLNAGAGSGKTHSLIESVRYLLKVEGSRLKHHNQKIIVITFTNIAANEIKGRLGNSQLVLVSTIHDRLWALIKKYQKELVNIHLDRLREELNTVKQKINNEDRFTSLSTPYQENFIEIMEKYKNDFFKHYYLKAPEAKSKYEEFPFSFDIEDTHLLKSVGRFRNLVSNLYKKQKYETTIENIKIGKEGYKTVYYNAQLKRDRLGSMQISHNTLLKYAKSLVEKYPLLQKIVIHKYPYFFVDEHQDTNPLVIDILQILDQYAQVHKDNFFAGYYGDELQSIYSDGVGKELFKRHSNLREVNKNLNRRSAQEIITVINNIQDNHKQESIYSDSSGGSVKFYSGDKESVTDFIDYCKQELNIDTSNPLNCLILTNEGVANYVGIPTIYSVMHRANLYSEGLGFERLNEEMLSKNFDKLGEVQKTLYNLFHLLSIIDSKYRTVNNILMTNSIRKNISLACLNNMIQSLENIKGDTLDEILTSINQEYQDSNNLRFKRLVNHILNLDQEIEFDIEKYKKFLFTTLGKLYGNKNLIDDDSNERVANAKKTLKELLSISKDEFLTWYEFLNDSNKQTVKYHTYHGTKGLQFENVIIVMEHSFGNKSYFDSFFKNKQKKNTLDSNDLDSYYKAQNLLYVAASRAIKNLRVFYIDDTSNLIPGIRGIFGEPFNFS